MNMAVTAGLALMPPSFSAGLDVWSQTTGRPGTATYDQAAYAAFVPSDADFGGCLEIQKVQSTTRLRWMGEVPVLPGLYLRIRARVKAMAGVFPDVAIAAWAGDSANQQVTAITTSGPVTSLNAYGDIVEISAIVGTGARAGVDMVWPTDVAFAHFGLDLTGPTGGVVRVDDVIIEDVSGFFTGDLVNVVDVRDFGALGDGSTDDRPAFVAALAAADGRKLLVPEGEFHLSSGLTITTEAQFRGTLSMPEDAVLILQRNFDQPSYASAFGDVELGFRKGVQALFNTSQHNTYDLKGRRVDLTAPVDVHALAGFDSSTNPRVLKNGQLRCVENSAWDTDTTTRTATYNPDNELLLTGVSNVAAVPVGARVSGVGVGREVYVRARNIGAGTLTLSQPLHGGAGTRSYTFERFKYALDFMGFTNLVNFELREIEFQARGIGSCVMLAQEGGIMRLFKCEIVRPKDRGITSIGRACQGLTIDNCQFISNESSTPAQDRTTIGFNTNANDSKIRNNRAARFAHFGVINGTGNIVSGNHFFGGDTVGDGTRIAGLVLTNISMSSIITGNYIDNHSIEITNEYAPYPEFLTGRSFGSLAITGNLFFSLNAAPWFRWIVIKPYGPGHNLRNFTVTGNAFRTASGAIERAETVDTTYASLNYQAFRNVIFADNAFNGVDEPCESPTVILHDQNTPATTWVIGSGNKMPFNGHVRTVTSTIIENGARDSADQLRYDMPYVTVGQGPENDRAHLRWPVATRGRAVITMCVDRPL